MSSAAAPDRKALVRAILASDDPTASLLRTLENLDTRRDLEAQAAVFEAVMWRVDRLDYWAWYRMGRVYAELGRKELAFFCSVRTTQIDPEREASSQAFRDMLQYFRHHGDDEAAASVATRQRRLHPKQP